MEIEMIFLAIALAVFILGAFTGAVTCFLVLRSAVAIEAESGSWMYKIKKGTQTNKKEKSKIIIMCF